MDNPQAYNPLQIDDSPHLVIEGLDEHGNVTERIEGESLAYLARLHKEGRCDAMCAHCYHEACLYSARKKREEFWTTVILWVVVAFFVLLALAVILR